ncbi:MAG: hypothetical protein FWG55_00120 [Candidatus Bathyarchaeota archaeon]|nr:hypothetical protein [Candidatus Termiticorpusculum sp.]
MKKIFGSTMVMVFGLAVVTVLLLSVTVFADGLLTAEKMERFNFIKTDRVNFIKTDRFDVMKTEDGLSMISRDGELIIHVSEGTEIVFEDGTDARGRLVDGQTLAELLDSRNLTVSYSITTRSLPPQTTPEKIIIFYEIAVPLPAGVNVDAPVGIVPPIYEFSPEEKETLFPFNDVDAGTPMGIVPPIYEFSPEEKETLFPLPIFTR